MARREEVSELQVENDKLKVLLGFLGPEDIDLDSELMFVQQNAKGEYSYRPSQEVSDHVSGTQGGTESSTDDATAADDADDATEGEPAQSDPPSSSTTSGTTSGTKTQPTKRPSPVESGRGFRKAILGTSSKPAASKDANGSVFTNADINTKEGREAVKAAWAEATNQK